MTPKCPDCHRDQEDCICEDALEQIRTENAALKQHWLAILTRIETKYRQQRQHICADVVKECITNLQLN